MAVLNKEDFMNRLKSQFGEDTSDNALSFIGDMTDTFNDMESRATASNSDWQNKYNELDNNWRKKYKERFFESATPPPGGDKKDPEDNAPKTFNELFKERK